MSGNPLTVEMAISSPQPIEGVKALVTIYTEAMMACAEFSSDRTDMLLNVGSQTSKIAISLERLDLAAGKYFVSVGLFSPDWEEIYDYHHEAYAFEVRGLQPTKGYLMPPHEWRITK
ncbi:hypothetical protein D3C87_1792800 [compost metagenome]